MTAQEIQNSINIANKIWDIVRENPFFLIGVLIYAFWVFNLIIDKKHYYTARFMSFAEVELQRMNDKVMKRVRKEYKEFIKENPAYCQICQHPIAEFQLALRISTKEILHDLKMARHKNGYHNKDEKWVENYCRILSRKLHTKSQQTIRINAPGLHSFLDKSDNKRFTEEEAYQLTLKIIKEDIVLHRLERRDILGVVLIFKQLIEVIKR